MKKRILVVDDDASIRSGLKKILKRKNYEVITAADGFEATERFFSNDIDLLILDLNMPGKDGWAASENITRNNPYVPTIIITGLPNQLPIASAAGVGALLEKPFDPEDLLRTIEELFAEPRFDHWFRRRGWLYNTRYVSSPGKVIGSTRNVHPERLGRCQKAQPPRRHGPRPEIEMHSQ